jgi:hypothetical protein
VAAERLVGNCVRHNPALPSVITRTGYRKVYRYRYQPQEHAARHKSERVLVFV